MGGIFNSQVPSPPLPQQALYQPLTPRAPGLSPLGPGALLPPPSIVVEDVGPSPVGLRIEKWVGHPNIAEDLDDEVLAKISDRVFAGYDIDIRSRSDWQNLMEPAMKLAMQVMERKTTPWEGASNVKYPLLTVAALQFNARALAVIIQAKRVVRGEVIGRDLDGSKSARADRVASFLNWQLLEQMEEWEEDTDKMLVNLPIMGCAFKKTHPDPMEKRPRSEFVSAFDLVVNYKASSTEDAPRITQEIELYEWEIKERTLAGLFLDVDLGSAAGESENSEGDEDAPHVFLEQHCRLDLDEDGYSEPYVVWAHKQSKKVVRIIARYTAEDVFVTWGGKANYGQEKTLAEAQSIGLPGKAKVARIQPIHYFTKYTFIPSPDDGFYGLGFGALLFPINESINTAVNQLLDAGHLANVQCGFVDKSLKVQKGEMKFRMGEWKEVNAGTASLKDGILPFQYPGPSSTLYTLLEFLVNAGEKISSIQDIMLGDLPQGDTPATTTLAAIEQAVKLFTGIFKRVHKSLQCEMKKILRLDRDLVSVDLYMNVLDDPQATIEDLDLSDHDIKPVSDPSIVSDSQKALKAQLLLPLAADPALNKKEILTRYFDATDQSHPEKLFAPPAPPMVDPRIQFEREKFQAELPLKAIETEANVRATLASAVLSMAKAEAQEAGTQMDAYSQQVEGLKVLLGDVQNRRKMAMQQRMGEAKMMAGGKGAGPRPSPNAVPEGLEQMPVTGEEDMNGPIGMGGMEIPSGDEDLFSMAEPPPERANRGTLPATGVDLLRNEQSDLRRFNEENENQPAG